MVTESEISDHFMLQQFSSSQLFLERKLRSVRVK